MRILATVAIVSTALAGAASAQMKVTQQQRPAGNQGAVKVQAPTLVQQPEAPLESARRMERDQAIKLVKAGKAVWVDVRSKESYDAGHIKGAINIPLSEITLRMKDLPFGKTIITYCA